MPSTSALSGIPELSLSAAANSDYRLVGEGAANAVFEVVVPPSDRICREIFQGRLLRVPKAGTSAHSCFEIQEYWETAVRPLFEPEDLVQHQLIKLGQDAVTSQLNSALARADHFRRADFRGSRVAATEYGMLVEDMRPSMATYPSSLASV
ncbi:uncharacterized protein THITE_2119339 [Thermothielavioides terrestris NRRL 8126]|uniref:Inositol-pentakisphosphate 2-kinase n=1 Tax=Thermothielavioides terrestris (strain ATCC 38088 / NRRL 8126) TaxID=578455 RepID=G2RBN1_THETT|nr:uncharacterized protein THITE_2119339 [Thermothielavioides terrestris NRRL 8126]AEO69202.1 hypothetical protein THITE_2119339 [Thermothielavioides terrestris NRRL 8126]